MGSSPETRTLHKPRVPKETNSKREVGVAMWGLKLNQVACLRFLLSAHHSICGVLPISCCLPGCTLLFPSVSPFLLHLNPTCRAQVVPHIQNSRAGFLGAKWLAGLHSTIAIIRKSRLMLKQKQNQTDPNIFC